MVPSRLVGHVLVLCMSLVYKDMDESTADRSGRTERIAPIQSRCRAFARRFRECGNAAWENAGVMVQIDARPLHCPAPSVGVGMLQQCTLIRNIKPLA